MTMGMVVLVLLIALAFTYINGFHDTANSIATVVATKVLTPGQAVLMAAVTNLIGALWGTAVAVTIAKGLIDIHVVDVGPQLLVCALLRSEERRVGKECRSRWSQKHEIKKHNNDMQ